MLNTGLKLIKYFLILVLIIMSNTSHALGQLGHQIVCQVAYDHLSSEKQQQITSLLSSLSQKDKQLINRYTQQKENTVITFANACTWADAIKKDPTYDSYKPWHYLNLSRESDKITTNTCEDNCISQAIPFHQQQLATAINSNKRVEALMFLGHWLGDIHQPLHISYADDLGGNRRSITLPQGKCNNLHWLWDSCLLTAKINDDESADIYAQLIHQLTNEWNSAPIQQWQAQQPLIWANESLTLVREASFKYCQQDGQGVCKKLSAKVVHLPQSYLVHYQPILEKRILQAAVRLNGLLNISL